MPSERNILKMSCNMNISLLSSELVLWKESSRGGNIKESLRTIKSTRKPCSCLHGEERTHCGRLLLTGAGLHVCGSSRVWQTSFSCHLCLFVTERMTAFDTKLEPFGGVLLTLRYLNLFPFPPALFTLVVKGNQ